MSGKPRVKTAEITVTEFQDLDDRHFMGQLEWIQENIDPKAVGVSSLEWNVAVDEEPEAIVNYYVGYSNDE